MVVNVNDSNKIDVGNLVTEILSAKNIREAVFEKLGELKAGGHSSTYHELVARSIWGRITRGDYRRYTKKCQVLDAVREYLSKNSSY